MKRFLSVFTLTALIFCAVFSASCGNGGAANYNYKDGKIVSSDGKKTFLCAPMGFQPYHTGVKCATLNGKTDLYSLIGKDGKSVSVDEWMSEEYAGNMSSVYYRDSIDLPSFDKIVYSACDICEEDQRVVSFASIEDKAAIVDLIDRLANGTTSFNRLDDAKARYTLKFFSDDFPAIMFSADLFVYDDAIYLYAVSTGRYAEVTELLASYIEEAESGN